MDATAGTLPVLHEERLWPSPGWWGVVAVAGVLAGATALPLGAWVAVPAVVVVVVAAVAGLLAASPHVVVAGGELRAGPAHVPLALLGEAVALRGEDARQARGPGLDARAFLLIRGWVDPVVRVELVDPADPTPYWLVSTRRPEDLVGALAAGRTDPRAG